jgi:hypothetical protein
MPFLLGSAIFNSPVESLKCEGGGGFVAMPRAIMRLVGTLTELLRVRELNSKFNRGPKRRPKG